MQTGHDIESTLVVLALVTGAVLVLARMVLSAAQDISAVLCRPLACTDVGAVLQVITSGPSPPLSLRI